MQGRECALREEGVQAIKRDVLHVESTHYGTETDVPLVNPILAAEGISWDGTSVL